MRRLAALVAAIAAIAASGCASAPASGGSGSGGGGEQVCASGASGSCPTDQPSLVTCPSGATYEPGPLETCEVVYPSGVDDPGATAFCCGQWTVTLDSGACDTALVTSYPPYSYDTLACTVVSVKDAGSPTAREWCCPVPDPTM